MSAPGMQMDATQRGRDGLLVETICTTKREWTRRRRGPLSSADNDDACHRVSQNFSPQSLGEEEWREPSSESRCETLLHTLTEADARLTLQGRPWSVTAASWSSLTGSHPQTSTDRSRYSANRAISAPHLTQLAPSSCHVGRLGTHNGRAASG